jgi:gluconokinase
MSKVPLRSPKDKLAGWVHLPRFVDKVRLHHAGKLPPDYQANFCGGFDGRWLAAAGVAKETFLEAVRAAKDDAAVEKWVRENVRKAAAEVEAFNRFVLERGRNDDASARLKEIKQKSGLAGRDDIQTFVDLIEADEGRL